MNVNYVLQERKRQRLREQKIHETKLKRKFESKKKYFTKELDEKLGNDILAEKKKQFYETLLSENPQVEIEQPEPKEQINNDPKPNQNNIKTGKTKKEKRQIKKVFTQRNSKGQPIMKNYLNVLVKQIEKSKKKP